MSKAWDDECRRQDQELISQLRLDILRLKNENRRLVTMWRFAGSQLKARIDDFTQSMKEHAEWMESAENDESYKEST